MCKSHIHVLLVEDNLADVVLLEGTLEQASPLAFELTVANYLSQGLDCLRNQSFDVILLDLGLPDSEGLVTFTELHTQIPDIPIVVFSGLHDDELAATAVRTGAQDYLVKGQTGSEVLVRAIRYAIERQRITEEIIRARNTAEAATQAKSAFLASMSHEIRTPLNAVIGMADLLRDTGLNDEQQEIVDIIRTGGQALLAVINDILDFSRIEAGHVALESNPFDLPECLGSTVNLIAHGAHQKGLTVTYTCDPSVPKAVAGDKSRLRQVLLNLLGNAVKFTSRGRVALYATADHQGENLTLLNIGVHDSGIGMTPSQMEHIFEPFVQADSTTAWRYGGSGLGLAISRQLITLMGGSISVTSAPGMGSSFTIQIPFLLTPISSLPRPIEPILTLNQTLRILVAEDNPVNQQVMQQMLARLGHTVTVVTDGQAAVEAVAQQPYDVVLMDMQMPILDGEAATRKIRQRGNKILQPHIIALTASTLSDDRDRAFQSGMDDYLSKPVQPADLQQVLARIVQHETGAYDTTEASSAVPDKPLIDWAVIDHLLTSLGTDGPAIMTTMVELFEEVLSAQMDTIDAALADGDITRIRLEAHRLRGGCLHLGAVALVALCDQLEHATHIREAVPLAARIRICYGETHALLREAPQRLLHFKSQHR